MLAALGEGAIPQFGIGDRIEFALCFGGVADAERALASFLDVRPDVASAIGPAVDRLRTEGVPASMPNGYADTIARAIVAYGLTASR